MALLSPEMSQGLLSFLQSPQAAGLAEGLLSQAAPSMTEPRSMAAGMSKGMGLGQKYADQQAQRDIQRGQLDVSRGNLSLQQQKYQKELEQQQRMQEMFAGLLAKKQNKTPDISPYGAYASTYGTENNVPQEYTDIVNQAAANGENDPFAFLSPQEIQVAGMLAQTDPKAAMTFIANSGKEQNLTGIAQEYRSVEKLGEIYGTDSAVYKKAKAALDMKEQQAQGLQDYRESITQNRAWNALPSSAQEYALGIGRALGLDPAEIRQSVGSGKTLADISAEMGVDITTVDPDYYAQSANIVDVKKRQGTQAALNAIEKPVSEGMAPYAGKVKGLSFKQVVDAVKGDDPDKQAKFLASRAMQPEIAAMRVSVGAGNVTEGMISGMVDKAMGNARVIEGQVSPEVYSKMQEYLNKWLNDSTNALASETYGRTKPRADTVAAKDASMDYTSLNPDWTPENIKSTMQETGLTLDEVKQLLGIN